MEDELSLFGFQSSQEREQFDLLLLSERNRSKACHDHPCRNGCNRNRKRGQQSGRSGFPGHPRYWPKTAKLILISLGGKVGLSAATPEKERVLQALVQLGTEESQARKVLSEIDGSLGESEALRAALAELGKGKLK